MNECIPAISCMVESDRLTERTEYNRVNTRDIAGTDRMHGYRAFLAKGLFSLASVNERFRERTASFATDVFSQRHSAAAGSILFKTMVLLDDLDVIFVAQ